MTGSQVILGLKIAVSAVSVLLLASLVALGRGNLRLHGRINIVFFVLTLSAVVTLEVIVRIIQPDLFAYLDEPARQALTVHLCFSMPAVCVLPVMLYTGLTHRRGVHLVLGAVFGVLWLGTFITGVFFLPHSMP